MSRRKDRLRELDPTGRSYSSWRYGAEKRLISLPPVFNKDKRSSVVSKLMDVMRDWRSSPFEHEATCRHSIRSALCLQGNSWPASDQEAARVVAESLMRLGAERPTWDEGQREYVTPRENCYWCGGLLAEDAYAGNRKDRFCSSACARSAIASRNFGMHYRQHEIGSAAYRIISRERTDLRTCKHCGEAFHPASNGGHGGRQVFCSVKCRSAARRVVPERQCQHCERVFRPGRADKIFCSDACYRAHGPTIRRIFRCEFCSRAFDAKSANARYCGAYCREKMARLVSGRWRPNAISPPVFDQIFKIAA